MNQQDPDIRAMLGVMVASAPEPPTAVAILDRANDIIPTVDGPERRRGSVRVLLTAAAAAALIAGLVAVTANRSNDEEQSVAPSFSPPGAELQLAVTPSTATEAIGVVKPESAVQVTVAGQFNLSWYTTVAMYEGHAIQMDCDSRGGCSPYLDIPGAHTALVTDTAGNDFWAWIGLPSSATSVVYTAGDNTQWQRPINGIAAFPATAGHKASFSALDEAGVTVDTAQVPIGTLDIPPFDWSRYRDLTPEQQDQMHLVINDAITTCLQTPGDNWSSCLAQADQALVQWFDDRANERRANNGTTP
jgi:hypothetical protein